MSKKYAFISWMIFLMTVILGMSLDTYVFHNIPYFNIGKLLPIIGFIQVPITLITLHFYEKKKTVKK